jgi:hypothetical protein
MSYSRRKIHITIDVPDGVPDEEVANIMNATYMVWRYAAGLEGDGENFTVRLTPYTDRILDLADHHMADVMNGWDGYR